MNVSLFIARRHLFSKKSRGIINIISVISMLVVAFITAAMITVLSAFNGIDDLVKNLFANFDSPLTIHPNEGKVFADSLLSDAQLKSIEGVAGIGRIIEEDAWLRFADHNAVATIKGIDDEGLKNSPIKSMIYDGEFLLKKGKKYYAVAGLGVRSELYMPLSDYAPTILHVNAPIRGRKLSRDKDQAFNNMNLEVSGIFSVNAELDAKYVMVPLEFARELFGLENEISGIEIFLNEGADEKAVKQKLDALLPGSLHSETRYDKNALIYKTNASEKWATFLILFFILLIACFNIIASLTMLIIEKKRDIFTLSSMGAKTQSIVRIFINEGIMINAIGAILGTVLGLALCFGQQHFGWIKMQGAMVDSYPIQVSWLDVIGIFITVVLVGSLFSGTLVKILMRRFASNNMMN